MVVLFLGYALKNTALVVNFSSTLSVNHSRIKDKEKFEITVFPRIVSALEYFPPLNTFRS